MSGEDAGGGTDVLDRELEKLLEEEQLDEGDHDRYSHYVKKNKILSSAISGKAVIALCRKKMDTRPRPRKIPRVPHV